MDNETPTINTTIKTFEGDNYIKIDDLLLWLYIIKDGNTKREKIIDILIDGVALMRN